MVSPSTQPAARLHKDLQSLTADCTRSCVFLIRLGCSSPSLPVEHRFEFSSQAATCDQGDTLRVRLEVNCSGESAASVNPLWCPQRSSRFDCRVTLRSTMGELLLGVRVSSSFQPE